jgi:hypothetical protein
MRTFLILLVLALPAFGRTWQEFREDIAARDRQITELRGQVERLRYVAGDGVAVKPGILGTPAAQSARQHAETIAAVSSQTETSQDIKKILLNGQKNGLLRAQRMAQQDAANNLSHLLLVLVACLLTVNSAMVGLLVFRKR